MLIGITLMVVAACRGDGRAVGGDAQTQPFARPNVLLITIDALRADHLGAYGYGRGTSPHMDALARSGTVFEEAHTYWPKTRGSFAAMLTGRTAARTGYSARHPGIAVGSSPPTRRRLFAHNDRGLLGAFDARFKLVATPSVQGPRLAFYDRSEDPAEVRLAGAGTANELRESRREMELFTERTEREAAATQRLVEGAPSSEDAMSREGCEKLKALGYVSGGVDCGR